MRPPVRAHIEAERRLRAAASDAIGRAWRDLGSWNEKDVERFLRLAVPIVESAQRQSVAVTDAFLARAVGRSPIGVPFDDVAPKLRNGVGPEEVYRRPFVELWSKLSDEVPWADAVDAAGARAMSSAATDVQLAMRQTLSDIGEQDAQIFGYERVPDGAACDLCLIASTQRYHTEDLMPIHNNCGCGVEPITDSDSWIRNEDRYREVSDNGSIDAISDQRAAGRLEKSAAINQARADEIRERMKGITDPDTREKWAVRAQNWDARAQSQRERAAAIRESRSGSGVAVRQHGELGPVLTDKSHEFTAL